MEIDAFLEDGSARAYEKVVDRLLRSQSYGEHMARYWLDAARYGDTHGLHLDNYREMWPYRDWIIDAFNTNKPFDSFVIEQLAGDLLESPTQGQRIATGFNRSHVTTGEGGSITEEVYVRNVIDRVETTGIVFMGLTVGCAACHDHKYDPITQREFYQLFAYFNSLDGNPLDGNRKDHAPVIRVKTAEAESRIAAIAKERDELEEEIEQQLAETAYTDPGPGTDDPIPNISQDRVWIDDDLPPGAKAYAPWNHVKKETHPVYSGNTSLQHTATGLGQDVLTAAEPLKLGENAVLFAHVYLDPSNPPKEIMLQFNDGDWEQRAYWGENLIDWGKDKSPSRFRVGDLPKPGEWVRLEVPAEAVGLTKASRITGWAFTLFDGSAYWDKSGVHATEEQEDYYKSLSVWLDSQTKKEKPEVPPALKTSILKPAGERTETEIRALRNHFIQHVHPQSRATFQPLHDRLKGLDEQKKAIDAGLPTTLVWKEKKTPKDAFLLIRGDYDNRGVKVARGTPKFLPPFPEGASQDRLGLAQWLVHPEHPLTSRIAVNRFWQQIFGVGIVKTAENFGSQSEWPSHPDLLDWLAVDFQETGWDVQRLMRQIVMSSTYQQKSTITPESFRRDPDNRLLTRGPRFRLDAEMLRDQALALSGLLIDRVGGPSVKPPQPDGLWFAVGYSGSNTVRFKPDQGREKVHRRSLYTFLKRTAPAPQMNTFDAPSRESCTVRRERTNTPLQALLLMNDPQYLEAARSMGERALREIPGSTSAERLRQLFRWASARYPDERELTELRQLLADYRQTYQPDIASAKELIAIGESGPDASLDPVDTAVWTMIANLILNLDEVVTKN